LTVTSSTTARPDSIHLQHCIPSSCISPHHYTHIHPFITIRSSCPSFTADHVHHALKLGVTHPEPNLNFIRVVVTIKITQQLWVVPSGKTQGSASTDGRTTGLSADCERTAVLRSVRICLRCCNRDPRGRWMRSRTRAHLTCFSERVRAFALMYRSVRRGKRQLIRTRSVTRLHWRARRKGRAVCCWRNA
jgi:hypothetical protein